ncbi:MAG: BRO family protein [Cellulosilyticaceae bacterium]
MKNELMEVFENSQFGNVRVVLIGIDKEPYFVGKDVAECLGYSNTRDALSKHVDEEDKVDGVAIRDAIGREQKVVAINESGLYSLVLGSKLQSAKEFKRWVTKVVLPTIRKTGQYNAFEDMSPELQAIIMQDKKIQQIETKVSELEDNIYISRSQQKKIRDFAKEVVVKALGSKHSEAYKEFSQKAFSEFWKSYQNAFNISSYLDTPKKDFQEALEFVNDWEPNKELKYMILGANTQIRL